MVTTVGVAIFLLFFEYGNNVINFLTLSTREMKKTLSFFSYGASET